MSAPIILIGAAVIAASILAAAEIAPRIAPYRFVEHREALWRGNTVTGELVSCERQDDYERTPRSAGTCIAVHDWTVINDPVPLKKQRLPKPSP